MGNPKVRFSEFIPNAWFHKPKTLHHQPTTKNTRPPPLPAAGGHPVSELHGELPLSLSPPRKSYHFTRNLVTPKSSEFDTPRKSSRRRIRRKPTSQKSNPSEAFTQMVSLSSNSVIRDDRSGFLGRRKTGDSVSSVSSHELRPTKTERDKKMGGAQEAIDDPIEKQRSSGECRGRRANGSLSVNAVREESSMASSVCSFKEQGSRSVRRSPNGSPRIRIRIRIHSPRLARRAQVHSSRVNLSSSPSKKGVSSKSLAVVKSSSDPQRDFRESMVEMIVENKIRASKDLEELLACYLSLNSDKYHDVIIEAFTQIWFDLNNIMKHIKK